MARTTLFLAALLGLFSTLPATAQDTRPPIAMPGAGVASTPADTPTDTDKTLMASAIRRSGCFIHVGNLDAVLGRYDSDPDKAKAVLAAMAKDGTVTIDHTRATVDLVGCAPVPLADDNAIPLQ